MERKYFAYGEPNDPGGLENCVETNWGMRGNWNDRKCDAVHTFLCQKAAKGDKEFKNLNESALNVFSDYLICFSVFVYSTDLCNKMKYGFWYQKTPACSRSCHIVITYPQHFALPRQSTIDYKITIST